MPARTDVWDNGPRPIRIWVLMTGLSVLFHALFFSGVVFLPQLRSSRQYVPSAVEVDLVSLPGAAPESQPASTQMGAPPEPVESPEPVKPEAAPAEPVPPEPDEVSEKPVPVAPSALEVKRSLKKKTFDSSKVIQSAIAKLEKEAPVSRPRSVLQAIDKLKQGVDSEGGVFLRGGMGAGGVGKKTLELLDIYNTEIWDRIQKNWAFSEEMAGGRTDLEATIIVKIMKKGEIRDVWFEKRSGNAYFDDSVFKAVKKSDPLPPLPESFRGPFYEVGLRFNPDELKRGY
jgi:colicin import membrane protein